MTSLLSNHTNGFCQTYEEEMVKELIETGTVQGLSQDEVEEMKSDLVALISQAYKDAH